MTGVTRCSISSSFRYPVEGWVEILPAGSGLMANSIGRLMGQLEEPCWLLSRALAIQRGIGPPSQAVPLIEREVATNQHRVQRLIRSAPDLI